MNAIENTEIYPALVNFVNQLSVMLKNALGDATTVTIDPSGKKFIRLVKRHGVSVSVYCFIEVETGNILKPASWKAPEPKRHPRGNIHAINPIEGCGPYGVAYLR